MNFKLCVATVEKNKGFMANCEHSNLKFDKECTQVYQCTH